MLASIRLTATLCALATFVAAAPAQAIGCYQIWDRREVRICRSTLPPFDLSLPAFERAMDGLAAQAAHRVFFDAAACPGQGSTILSVREGVAGPGWDLGGTPARRGAMSPR